MNIFLNGRRPLVLPCVTAGFLFFVSCAGPLLPGSVTLRAPPLPVAWEELLGPASWRFEWTDPSGTAVRASCDVPVCSDVKIPGTFAHPIIAYPYWPEKNIYPGDVKPAGAIFPFDLLNDEVLLTFSGGVDAFFYRELAAASNKKRLPYNFDWPRFRQIRTGDAVDEEIARDPWNADWKAIAEKTVSSGFSSRRIKVRETQNLSITVPADGPWISDSPFWEPSDWKTGEKIAVRVSDSVDSYFCGTGILHVSGRVFTWKEYVKLP